MMTPSSFKVQIEENRILFPEGYPFVFSSIAISNEIKADRISEVNFRTFPTSLVIDNNEVIFLDYSQEIQSCLQVFAVNNDLEVASREDVWYLLCTPFLDTRWSESDKVNVIQKLLECGFTREEVRILRWKIGLVMWRNFIMGQEWDYLGHFDYLRNKLLLSREKYWWTMSIALRNYKR